MKYIAQYVRRNLNNTGNNQNENGESFFKFSDPYSLGNIGIIYRIRITCYLESRPIVCKLGRVGSESAGGEPI
jgi:hypothetical protein